jgi:hypothetical protein
MRRFGANPSWFKTGEGEMFVSDKEYMMNGIKTIGIEELGERLIEIFKDQPQFVEL